MKKSKRKKFGDFIDRGIIYIMFETDLVRISDKFNEYFIEEFDTFCEVVIDDISQLSCTIKNPAFEGEKEVRIIYNPYMHDREIWGDIEFKEAKEYFSEVKYINDYKISPISFNYRNDQLITFYDIDFSKFSYKELIQEVIIGSKSRLKENDIYYFVLSNGFDANLINISKSNATYR